MAHVARQQLAGLRDLVEGALAPSEYNARELVHGSYGVENNHVVLTDTLELVDLDYTEFEASFDSITLALASHLGTLAPYRER